MIKRILKVAIKEYKRLKHEKHFAAMSRALDVENFPKFDSLEICGGSRKLKTVTKGFRNSTVLLTAQRELQEEIKALVPHAFRKNITWLIAEPKARDYDPLGQWGSLAWKYTPKGLDKI